MPNTLHPRFSLVPADEDDFESLLALRLVAMRESLERAGRYDPQRARERLSRGFDPRHTRKICVDGSVVGFLVVLPRADDLLLDHLYIHPSAQRQGVGHWVMQQVLSNADVRQLPVSVTALRHSTANRFYERHGFVLQHETDWDLHYLRPVPPADSARHG